MDTWKHKAHSDEFIFQTPLIVPEKLGLSE